MSKPQITIKTDGSGAGTHIYNEAGVELHDVQKAQIFVEAGKPTLATLTVFEINGELQAEVAAIEKKLVPPATPVESIQLRIFPPVRRWGRMRSRYRLTRYVPLPTWGTKTFLLAEGWMAPSEPTTIERMVK